MRFRGKVVALTGAGSGIGAAIARRFGREGAAVSLSDIQLEAAEQLAGELRGAGARAVARRVDVTREEDLRELLDRTAAEFGGVDVMVNNAGIGESPAPIEQKSIDEWDRIIRTNLTGVFLGLKQAVRVMKAQNRGGVIINVSSILGQVGFRGAPAYTAAKHGINGLTKSAALELASAGIRVVSVAPAFIRTPLIRGLEEHVLPLHPAGRLGEADEVASMVAFLASEEASFITGAAYLIDGGYTAQ